MRLEVWVDVKLADICGNVEEKGEPADPVEELNFADLSNLRRKTLHGGKDLMKERKDAALFISRRTFETRVTFTDENG